MDVVMYQEEFGAVNFPEGFEETIKGLPIEAQMEHFRTTCRSTYAMTGWGERTSGSGYRRLEEDSDVRGLIVKDDLLIGVMMCNDDGRIVPCLPEERVCTYYADDNNGAGSKTRIDYTWLVCVTEDFER